ncbi:hypothetical protein ACWGR4_02535 [Embleya sp. NPDC055664]
MRRESVVPMPLLWATCSMVDAGGQAGGGQDRPVLDVQHVGSQVDGREAAAEIFGHGPVRGGRAPVEQTGLSRHEGFVVVPNVLVGTPAALPDDLDAPQSWSYNGDVARTLVAAARSPESWGRAWHVPSSTASIRTLTTHFAAPTNSPPPTLTLSIDELHALGRENPIIAEFEEMLYLTDGTSHLDATTTTKLLEVTATPTETALIELATSTTR